MRDDVRLRPAVPGDAPAIAEVHRLSRAHYYGIDPGAADGRDQMWAELLAQRGRATHVAEIDDAVLGFVSMIPVTEPVAALELTALYVRPRDFRQGVGSALHTLFECEQGDRLGVLDVWEGNRDAIAFYVARGWTPTSWTRPGPRGRPFVGYARHS